MGQKILNKTSDNSTRYHRVHEQQRKGNKSKEMREICQTLSVTAYKNKNDMVNKISVLPCLRLWSG